MNTSLTTSLAAAAALLLALPASASPASPSNDRLVVPPRQRGWTDLVPRQFDLAQTLPEDTATGFVDDLTALTALNWDDGPRVDGRQLDNLGDVVAEIDRRGGSRGAVDAVLGALARGMPEVWARHGETLRQLLRDDVFQMDWDPSEDDDRDGLLMGPVRSLEGEARAPWRDMTGSRLVQQGAALLRADLLSIKEVENDYLGYLRHVGADYEEIGPVPDSYVRGTDASGRPYAALQIVFECDLPFPFSTYRCHLRILNRVDEDDRLVTDVYSTSRDFHWLAGRDTFLPVRTSDDELVGHVMVRQFGFDLDGVPDGDDARRQAVRSGIGNLKRRAERLQRGPLVDAPGEVPSFSVSGPRR